MTENLPSIRSLWDFSDPAKSEAVFAGMIPSGDAIYDLELQTQIARTFGLRRQFDEARAKLGEVAKQLPKEHSRAHIRYELELGRTENSSGNVEAAKPHFERALQLAQDQNEEFLAIDAAHMLGIANKGEEGLSWNLRAIEMAKAATDPEAKTWLGSLLNNTGWTLHDLERYHQALEIFKDAESFFEPNGGDRFRIAQWSVARCLRSLGRIDEALAIQERLLPNDVSGYAAEEMGECLLALGKRDEARPHFAQAAEKLGKDDWFVANCADRLQRLRELGQAT